MAEMVEKVADALTPFFSAADRAHGEPANAARAAIEAMRDLPEAWVNNIADPYDGVHAHEVRYVWSSIIDAALAEQKTPA